MGGKDRVEYYDKEKNALLLHLESSMIPQVGNFINIREETWRVDSVSFVVDHPENLWERTHRCNVELVRVRK